MVFHGDAQYSMVLHGIIWCFMVMYEYCKVLYGIEWLYMVFHVSEGIWFVLHDIEWYYNLLHDTIYDCILWIRRMFTRHCNAKKCNSTQSHIIPWNTLNTMQYKSNSYCVIEYHILPCNTCQYFVSPCNTMQYSMQYYTTPCNTI